MMFEYFPAYLVPVFIFLARIADVSLGTIRIVMVSRGFKIRAAVLGFFEVLIWTLVVTELLKNLDSWINYVAYAGGFAAGTFAGMYIETKLKVGTIIIRIIVQSRFEELKEALIQAGFTITTLKANGGYVPVNIIFTVLKRKRWNQVVEIIESIAPTAFYSAEDVKFTSSNGDLMNIDSKRSPVDRLLGLRKGI